MQNYILALDQGTTSSRAIVFDRMANVKALAQKEYEQYYPRPGWVEHDANEIWYSQASVAAEAISKLGISGKQLAALGVTNQRETTIIWDRKTGEPVYNAIVWQDKRTAEYCSQLIDQGHEQTIRQKTGLRIDSYFSATKIRWILDHVPGARKRAEKGELAFGTVDSWLIWKFSAGKIHITDVSNASRTMLFNTTNLQWDDELLDLFDVPKAILPEVRTSSEHYGDTATTFFAAKVPIGGIAGDQQAALFGQLCLEPGMIKNTYGTGAFIMMNTGGTQVKSHNNLISTVAWKVDNQVSYALEGSVFVAGALLQWMREGIGLIDSIEEVERLAETVPDNGGVYMVPAFTGLGAPHWDQYARGTICGITRGTTGGHIARAALESIAYQVNDVVEAMNQDLVSSNSGFWRSELRVDGRPANNKLLMQLQADILQAKVSKTKIYEVTALGAAFLAGLAVGFWQSYDEISNLRTIEKCYEPIMPETEVNLMKANWNKALGCALNWLK